MEACFRFWGRIRFRCHQMDFSQGSSGGGQAVDVFRSLHLPEAAPLIDRVEIYFGAEVKVRNERYVVDVNCRRNTSCSIV